MLVLKVLGRLRLLHVLTDFQLFDTFLFGFKAMRQDGKEIEISKRTVEMTQHKDNKQGGRPLTLMP